MEKFWKQAVITTGSVAVIGFIFIAAIEKLFQDRVLAIFGSDQVFYLVVFILSIIAITLILAVILNGSKSEKSDKAAASGDRTVSIDRSKIKGDVVLGDKTINQGRERD